MTILRHWHCSRCGEPMETFKLSVALFTRKPPETTRLCLPCDAQVNPKAQGISKEDA